MSRTLILQAREWFSQEFEMRTIINRRSGQKYIVFPKGSPRSTIAIQFGVPDVRPTLVSEVEGPDSPSRLHSSLSFRRIKIENDLGLHLKRFDKWCEETYRVISGSSLTYVPLYDVDTSTIDLFLGEESKAFEIQENRDLESCRFPSDRWEEIAFSCQLSFGMNSTQVGPLLHAKNVVFCSSP